MNLPAASVAPVSASVSVAAATAATAARQSLVVVGNGMAGMRTVEELLKLAPDRYDITVFGAEPHGNYNRILLSPVLAGDKQMADIMLHEPHWYAERGIVLYSGDPVEHIDRRRRTVRSRGGREVAYDRLLLATGSSPFILPVPGNTLAGVIAFRDIADVETMREAARSHRHAVVIGGGLLGLEAAHGLQRQGMDVTVVHVGRGLMERQLDASASTLLQSTLQGRGLKFVLQAVTAEIVGKDGRAVAVRLEDGREIVADLVVMTAGVRPNIHLARQAGIHCERAIVVDDTLQTYDPRVYAVGECVQHRRATFGLVAPIWEQARVCAAHLAGAGHRRYVQEATATRLKVNGVELYSAGQFQGAENTEELVLRDRAGGVYKRLVLRGDRLIGAVLYGEVADGPWYFDLIRREVDISGMRHLLLFGQAPCAAPGADAAIE